VLQQICNHVARQLGYAENRAIVDARRSQLSD